MPMSTYLIHKAPIYAWGTSCWIHYATSSGSMASPHQVGEEVTEKPGLSPCNLIPSMLSSRYYAPISGMEIKASLFHVRKYQRVNTSIPIGTSKKPNGRDILFLDCHLSSRSKSMPSSAS